MNRGVKAGVITTCIALLGAGGYGAYNFVHAVTDIGGSPGANATAASTLPPTSAEALKRAQSFLDSWHAGPSHYGGAASQTTTPDAAQSALTGYGSGLKLTSVSFSNLAAAGSVDPVTTGTGTASASKVTFTVTAQVAGGTWSYPDSLDVLQNVGGVTSVNWSPAVLYPTLQAGQTLSAGEVPADAASAVVTDRNGVELTAAKYPSLAATLTTVAQHSSVSGGAGGKGVEVLDANGVHVSTPKVFVAPSGAKIPTTLDAALQAKAEQAVRNNVLKGLPASVVAIDWRTGRILAVAYANTGADGNTALMGVKAPGSTMKIITAAALFDKAGMSPGTPAPCPSTIPAGNTSFHNDFPEPHLGDTITSAFARSCNTAFIGLGFDHLVHGLADTGDLADEAGQVFDLHKDNGGWSIGGGVATNDASVPSQTPDLATAAADLIGQGQVTMNPLALASMAATVRDSKFHQPIIVPGQKQESAPRPISGSTAHNLRTLMSAAAHEGTAEARVGRYSDAGAKTGTSEEGATGATTTNGWFTAYNDRIAVAALVQGGSTGVSSAGYVAAALIGATE